jgi:lipoprotein-anchoring transpeptidase ErfK/SrfK
LGVDRSRPPTRQVHFSTLWYPNVIVHQTSDSARLAEKGHVSDGCINLYRHDMKEFYDSVPVGARFVIRE